MYYCVPYKKFDDLNIIDMICLSIIHKHRTNHRSTEVLYNINALAEQCDVTKNTILRSLNRCVKSGYITKEQVRDTMGSWYGTKFILTEKFTKAFERIPIYGS